MTTTPEAVAKLRHIKKQLKANEARRGELSEEQDKLAQEWGELISQRNEARDALIDAAEEDSE